jgi:DNA-binding CsgD family transcriptional regulator
MLEQLGLDPDPEIVYRMMLDDPCADIESVGESCGWPAERVRAALDELAKLSLVRPSWEKPGALRLVSPEIGLASLLARQETALVRFQQEIAAGRVIVAQMVAEYASSHRTYTHPNVEQLPGIDAIRTRIEELALSSHDLRAFVPGGAQPEQSLEASRPVDEKFLGRGAMMRSVYLDSIRNDRPTVAYTKWLVDQGAEIRTVAELPIRMTIYDGQLALLPINPEETGEGAVLLSGAGVVAALCALFDQIWAGGCSVGAERTKTPDGLTSQEQAVLHLLDLGHTDEAVARKLGISVRTGRRITAELLDRLGARSRFQAGAKAMRRGWLPPTE